jgi:hypothetical protein
MAIWYEDDILIKPVRMPKWSIGYCRCGTYGELVSGLCVKCYDRQTEVLMKQDKKLRTYEKGRCKECGGYGELKYHYCEVCRPENKVARISF